MAHCGPQSSKEIPEALLREENLPSLPAVALRILELSKNEDSGLGDYADAIASDPALTAKVLRLSNSATLGLVREVTTLQQATSVLGLRTVNMMALGFSLVRAFPKAHEEGQLPLDQFWKRSLLGAVASREFGRLCGAPIADEAFLCGLLSEIGVLVIAKGLPEQFAEAFEHAGGWPTPDVERAVFGFEAVDVAEALLERWGMPALIRTGVGCWSDGARLPEDADDRARLVARIVALASAAVHVLCDEAKGEPLARLHELAGEEGISGDQVDTVLLTLELRTKQTAELLEVDLPEQESHHAILEEARRQLVKVGVEASVALDHAEKRVERLQKDLSRVIDRAQRDEVTGLRNRAAFEDILTTEVRNRRDRTVPGLLGLLMIDIDEFKAVNDSHGHQVGDEILHWVGQAILATCRESDTPARFGGDEFAIVVPSTTLEGLEGFGERIRRVLSEIKVPIAARTHSITVSVGAASLATAAKIDDGRELVSVADKLLYEAKAAGRDRSCICPVPLHASASA